MPATRLAALASSLLLLMTLLAGAIAAPVSATVSADALGDDVMRLTNLDRTALGKPALQIDPTLAAFARGMAWTCPNSTLVLGGRSVDMARRAYFSHSVKSCLKSDGTLYGSLDIMKLSFHYATTRGENLAWNRGYSTSATSTYGVGCPVGTSNTAGSGCPGGTTTTTTSVAIAQRGLMNSSGHRANILGNYDRFGCASGVASDGGVYYTCVFSLGGPSVAVTDAVLPRVTSETGKGYNFRRGVGHGFYATFSDNAGLRSGAVYIDGVKIRSWTFDGTVRSVRVYVYVSASHMKYGNRTLTWHTYDAAGLGSLWSDGKVYFHCY